MANNIVPSLSEVDPEPSSQDKIAWAVEDNVSMVDATVDGDAGSKAGRS